MDQELQIIDLYVKDNYSATKIAKIYNTYATTIKRILNRNNIKLRSLKEANNIIPLSLIKNQEGSSDFDYFIGLLATDGCITGNRVVLEFCEDNKELLDYWNKFLKNKCSINKTTHKKFNVNQYRIAFRNQEICDYLKQFGITERKSFDLKLSYINWNVLRGIIDGDGCILSRNNGNTLAVCITSASKEFLVQIQKFYDMFNITSYLKASNRDKNIIYDLYVYKTSDVIFIYNNLYKNAHFFLK